MKTLLDKYKPDYAEALAETFSALNLPIPNRGEYHRWDSTVVFLNSVGLTLRIQDRDKMPLLRHTHLLRPIGSIIADEKFRVDIVQGGKPATREKLSKAVHKKLKTDGIYTDDIKHKPQNSLMLKAVNMEFPEGIPVAYDPYKLKCYNRHIREFGEVLNDGNVIDLRPTGNETPDIQDELYGELREQFQSCVSKETGEIILSKLSNFYQSCAQYKSAGLLETTWNTKLPIFGNGRQSRKYAERLTEHNPIFTMEN